MNLNKKVHGYWVLLLLASFALLIGCQASEIASKWRDQDIVIDANNNEWQGAMQYYDDKTQTSIGISNDDTDLYLCLTTSDIEILTDVVTKGFIVWFNGKGSKAKELGIRFPVIEQGGAGGRGGAPPGEEGGRGGAPPGGQGAGTASLEELKILTSKKDEGTTFKVSDAAQMGISVWMANRNNMFVYEIKVPLHKTDKTPYAIVPSSTNYVGVGFMIYGTTSSGTSGISGFGGSTGGIDSGGGGMGGGGMGGGPPGGGGGFDMSSNRDFSMGDISSMSNVFKLFGTSDEDVFGANNDDVFVINAQGGGPPPGGGGGMGGGMGGGGMGGGSMGGSMPSQPQSFEVWTKVLLATKPANIE